MQRRGDLRWATPYLPAPQMVKSPRTKSTGSAGMPKGRHRCSACCQDLSVGSSRKLSFTVLADKSTQAAAMVSRASHKLAALRACHSNRQCAIAESPADSPQGWGFCPTTLAPLTSWFGVTTPWRKSAVRVSVGKLSGWNGSCVTDGRMRYSQLRWFSPRGATKEVPVSCSA